MSRPDDSVSALARISTLATMTLIGFLILVGQLWYLQVIDGARLSELADRNRIRVRPLVAPRGVLYDRNGAPLAESRPAFTLSVVPGELDRYGATLARLAILLRIPLDELPAALREAPEDSPWPVRIRRGLTFEDAIRVWEWRPELPGVAVEVEPRRSYASSRLAAHLLGYVREASRTQVREERYRAGEGVGQSGLERALDEVLRGREGTEYVEVDSLARTVRVVRRDEPRQGANVMTTLDRRLQEAAEQALGDAAGAVVVMDPRTGDILAMVSAPSFDLDRFAGPIGRDEWLRLVRDPRHPLLNRAFQSEYPPGSIFKLVVAAAALEEGVISPSDRLPCPSRLEIGDRTFANWRSEDLGLMDVRRAIAVSCNTFFYRLGLMAGVERIARYAEALGFGQPTGIALPGEKPGLIPSWGEGRLARPRLPGDTANLSIGQGRLLVTPLQVARFMAAIANGGLLLQPRLLLHVETVDGETQRFSHEPASRLPLSPPVHAVLRGALWSAVNEGGTGAAARVPGGLVAGKTGTAQIAGEPGLPDHAWFAGYAPADDPRVVVVVLLEGGGMGGRAAAPVAGRILHEVLLGTGLEGGDVIAPRTSPRASTR